MSTEVLQKINYNKYAEQLYEQYKDLFGIDEINDARITLLKCIIDNTAYTAWKRSLKHRGVHTISLFGPISEAEQARIDRQLKRKIRRHSATTNINL